MSESIMTIYPKSKSNSLDLDLFASPSAEYRGAPFWSWNSKLNREQLFRQLKAFREMGFGGAHIHCRTGLETRYLGREFMQIVRDCALHAKKLGLITYLYDEDRWPSGYAGGIVTKDPRYRAKHLLVRPGPYDESGMSADAWEHETARGACTGNGVLLARYAVRLRNGQLASYRRMADDERESSGETTWYAYLETATPAARFNFQTYVDTLDPKAIERFVKSTHETYKRTLGDLFGRWVPSIFTDEPQFARKRLLAHGDDKRPVILPFTTGFPESYRAIYGADVLETLPEIIWNLRGNSPSLARYRYHEHVAERFASAFADTLGRWCGANGLALTGHMMDEPTLESQSTALGEVMRSFRSFDIPGIDMLCDRYEFTTAKQAQSVARQKGAPGVMSELGGVTGWHFDFAGHKAHGDWQAALGVTLRVPHLAWASMKGDAKRDYPAPISYQSPWSAEFKLVEDHFARLNVVMTRGKPVVRVGVLHPVESFWLHMGPGEKSRAEREQLDRRFDELTKWLLFGTLDFDFIAESLLPAQSEPRQHPRLHVGEMRYDAVLVPGLHTIRSTTLDRLERFAAGGGRVIFLGKRPWLVDGEPSDRALCLAGEDVDFGRAAILASLEPLREVRIHPGYAPDWSREPTFLHQLREEKKDRYLFISNLDRENKRPETRIEVRGEWRVAVLNTLDGKRSTLAASYTEARTVIEWEAPASGSLLLHFTPGRGSRGARLHGEAFEEIARLPDPHSITLSEPNVLLLDQAEWRIEDGPWQELEESLRIHRRLCDHFRLPRRGGMPAQPWADPAKPGKLARIELRYAIRSDIRIQGASLALEEAESTEIKLDGRRVTRAVQGWYADEAIQTVKLPEIEAGDHELILAFQFTPRRLIEAAYLLGDFGVEVRGRRARVSAPVRKLTWGDWSQQGLPFYGGNVVYHTDLPRTKGQIFVQIPHFKLPVMRVALDGKDRGPIAFSPYRIKLPSAGRGALDITAFGNRANTFGIIHYPHDSIGWYGPTAYITEGELWTYEYKLKPMGILSAPIVWRARVEG